MVSKVDAHNLTSLLYALSQHVIVLARMKATTGMVMAYGHDCGIIKDCFTHDDAHVNTYLCQSSHADALSLYESVVVVHQQDVEMLRFQVHHLR